MAMMMSRKMSLAGKAQRSVAVKAGKTVSDKVKTVLGGNAATMTNKEILLTWPGISAPFPDMFDPLNFSEKADIEDIRRWRESELTHGRVAMLAALGFVIGEQLEDFPAFVNFDGSVTGPAINQFQQVRTGFWEALVLFIGIAEAYRVAIGWATPVGNQFNKLKEEYEPGTLGFDPLNLKPEDAEELKTLQTKELNNGRLAMIAIAGFVAQELVSNQEIFEHLFLRFEKEVILELDDIRGDLKLPLTPLPDALKGI